MVQTPHYRCPPRPKPLGLWRQPVGEACAEGLEGRADLDLDGLGCDTHDTGDLGVAQMVLAAEEVGFAATGRELADSPLDGGGEFGRAGGFVRLSKSGASRWGTDSTRLLAPFPLDPLVAQVAEGLVADGAVEIGRNAAGEFQTFSLVPHAEQDVLHQLLGDRIRLYQPSGEDAEAVVVLAEESLEGGLVAGSDALEPAADMPSARRVGVVGWRLVGMEAQGHEAPAGLGGVRGVRAGVGLREKPPEHTAQSRVAQMRDRALRASVGRRG